MKFKCLIKSIIHKFKSICIRCLWLLSSLLITVHTIVLIKINEQKIYTFMTFTTEWSTQKTISVKHFCSLESMRRTFSLKLLSWVQHRSDKEKNILHELLTYVRHTWLLNYYCYYIDCLKLFRCFFLSTPITVRSLNPIIRRKLSLIPRLNVKKFNLFRLQKAFRFETNNGYISYVVQNLRCNF